MGKTRPVQSSFSTGAISPSMLLRNDLEGFPHAVLRMDNFEASLAGPAVSRDGFENRYENDGFGSYGKLFPFNISPSESYLVWIGNEKIAVFDRNNRVGDNNAVVNPSFFNDGDDWTVSATGDGAVQFFNGLAYIDGGISEAGNATIEQAITVTSGIEYELIVRSHSDGACSIKLGTFSGGSDILDQGVSGLNSCFVFTPAVTTVYVSITADGGGTIDKEIDFVQIKSSSTGDEFTSPYTDKKWIEDLQSEMAPDVDAMYFTCNDVQPYKLTYDRDTKAFAFELVVFVVVDGAAVPIDKPWEDSAPSSVTFHDGRMWIAGSREFPVRIWASDPDDYETFTYSDDDLADDDAIDFNLKKRGDIRWIESVKDLQVSTVNSNNTIFSDGPVITAVDAEIKQQSVYGANRVRAVGLSDGLFWVTPNGTRVLFSQYSDELQGYKPTDVSFQAEHLTNIGLVDASIKQTPDQRMIFTTRGGDLVGCTFEPSRQVLGWYQYITDGLILSSTVIDEFGDSVLYILVLRGDTIRLERQVVDCHMDGAVHCVYGTPQSSLSGLDHLEGQEVQIRVDGAVQVPQTVSGGAVTLDPAGYDICVGLGFLAELETLPIEFIADGQGSPTLKKRFSKIFVRLYNSYVPIINGENPRRRNPITPMGTPETATSKDVAIDSLGWNDAGTIVVSQELPYRTEILGIFSELAMNGL